ncbi:DMT family transporter [uncultured Litoreibacter sp.]|uniref:DMT family transporter n=1 Tax=uncultured Litoreibacter sp. TaxID=1392394 RepID=UPI00262C2410|nr:DMT family transporter [uncultured Litoreibacter sp.]
MTLKNWALLVLTAMLFGSSFPLINVAVAEVPPMYIALARVTIAALILLGFLFATGRRLPPFGAGWRPLLVLGVLSAALPYFAIAWGQAHINSSLGGILFATIPIFTIILAPIFVDEARLPAKRMVGVAVAFAGVVTAIGVEHLFQFGGQALGAAATLVAALSYAIGNIYARTQTALHPLQLAAGQMLAATAILIPLTLLYGSPAITAPGPVTILATIAVAIVSTAMPVILMFTLIKRVGATQTSLLAFFIPVAAVLIGVIALGEPLGALTLLGFAMVIAGAVWATRTPANALIPAEPLPPKRSHAE